MKRQLRLLVAIGALALATVPAMALAGLPTDHGKGQGPHYAPEKPEKELPGPNATLPEKAQAYGVYCERQGFGKKHVAGQKGTPFSQCVTAAAKAAASEPASEPCRGFSHKHVKGKKGTPFSRCVVAAAQAKKAARQS